jgi:hypothetical protein
MVETHAPQTQTRAGFITPV